MKRIHLISSPRNISTALMYSFGNRSDTAVVDEPFYANYLSRVEIKHPGQEEIMTALPVALDSVIEEYVLKDFGTENLFVKNMAHHIYGIDYSFAIGLDNLFLIRNPKHLICSFEKVIPNPTMRDIGVKAQFEIYQNLIDAKANTVVVDSNELLKNPKKVLSIICDRLGVSFNPDMLSWEAGPRKEDGVWAKHWYDNVHRSTGFEKQRKKDRILPEHLKPLCEEANHYYEIMYEHSIKA